MFGNSKSSFSRFDLLPTDVENAISIGMPTRGGFFPYAITERSVFSFGTQVGGLD